MYSPETFDRSAGLAVPIESELPTRNDQGNARFWNISQATEARQRRTNTTGMSPAPPKVMARSFVAFQT